MNGGAGLARARKAWMLYDWANSAFALSVMSALFPPFFRNLALDAGFAPGTATAMWGYVTAAGLLLVALAAPLLGAVADVTGGRKRYLGFFLGLGVIFTSLFVFIGPGAWRLAALLFIGANFGFAASIIFYESLLPGLASGPELDSLSARAYSLGYAGSGILLVLNLAWVMKPGWFGMPDAGFALKASFLSVAVWWGVFSVPLLRHVPEPPVVREPGEDMSGPVAVRGFRRLWRTFGEIRRQKPLVTLLVAYWIYNDGIGTIVKMATAYGSELGISRTDMIGALLLTQVVGIPCALACGRLARVWGAKRTVLLTLGGYLLISVGGFLMATPLHFTLLAVAVGMVQGGAQALSRSLFASMVPAHRSAEYFGFFATSGKLAGVTGPLVFGLVSHLSGTGRLGILSLIVFFVLGGALLARVDVAAGVAEARRLERDSGVA